MSTLPSLFLSHGAPTLPLTDAPARAFLSGLGDVLTPPRAILMVSAHWEPQFRRSAPESAMKPSMIFGDFRAHFMK